MAFTGAEPISPQTLERFANAFAPYGFRKEAFYPCYGLAEATLMVSGTQKGFPVVQAFDRSRLEQHQAEIVAESAQGAKLLVSSGRALPGHRIVIVHPDTLEPCPSQQVGEIWLAGPSVAQGYWNRQQETEQTFRAYLASTHEGPFLRTADLGFFVGDDLFITGRLKDLIIIRGQNYYAHDIEQAVLHIHTHVTACAAFSVEVQHAEQLVIVLEMGRHFALQEADVLLDAVRQAVARQYDLRVYAIALVRSGGIPKTSSGKTQRRLCRAKFLANTLPVLLNSIQEAAHSSLENILAPEVVFSFEQEEKPLLIVSYLQQYIAQILHKTPQELNVHQPLHAFGLDSLNIAELKGSLEEAFHLQLSWQTLLSDRTLSELGMEIVACLPPTPALPAPLSTQPESTDVFPLSFGQRALWFLQQLMPESASYNLVFAIRVLSRLDILALQQAFQVLSQRHALLRSNMRAEQGNPLLYIHAERTPSCHIEDAQTWSEEFLATRLVVAGYQPFDLAHDPLWRIHMFTRPQQRHVLLFSIHHSIADLWSLSILLQDLALFYERARSGQKVEFSPPDVPYTEYICWQTRILEGSEGKALHDYWQRQLTSVTSRLEWPLVHPKQHQPRMQGAEHMFTLPQTVTQQVKALARQQGVTVPMLLLAVFQALLYRHTGQKEILVGSPATGRSKPAWNHVIGYFVNPLVLRASFSHNMTFAQLLSQVRQTLAEGLDHQDYPFALLVEHLQPERAAHSAPLFQVMFAFQHAQEQTDGVAALALNKGGVSLRVGELVLESLALERREVPVDLALLFAEIDGELAATLQYKIDLFEHSAITMLSQHYQALLQHALFTPNRPLAYLDMLTVAEREQQLTIWNKTAVDFPTNMPVHLLFEIQAERAPDAIAVVDEDHHVTYGWLNRLADGLAHLLCEKGSGPEAIVGLCLERSLELLVGQLAVLKAGGAYLPLDPQSPGERLTYMLQNAKVAFLLVQPTMVERINQPGVPVLCLDMQSLHEEQTRRPSVRHMSTHQLAYVIYTSGSTGVPKGVQLTHRGLMNLINWHQKAFEVSSQDRASQIAGLAFDASVWEVWPYLLSGACISLVPELVRLSPTLLRDWLVTRNITISFIPTPLVEYMVALDWPEKSMLRYMLVGGDRLHPVDTQKIPFTLVNNYGPTEYTVVATSGRIISTTPEEFPTIGRAIANTQLYILDGQMELVPVGVPGELYIAGAGLARGYLHQPALTAEYFVPNPFSYEPGARLYRTGDRVRYLTDGNFAFIGREDAQIKIRGYRVELGEIEAILVQHAGIQQAIAHIHKSETGVERLLAYVIPQEGQQPAIDELRHFLERRLPDYMLPTSMMVLETLPLTANDKIDYQALPVPDDSRTASQAAFVAPRTSTEQVIARIWQQVLGLQQIGVDDNFFTIGGHSLLATQVVSRLREAFELEIPLHYLFEAVTIGKLARVIDERHDIRPAQNGPALIARDRQAFKMKRSVFTREQTLQKGNPSS